MQTEIKKLQVVTVNSASKYSPSNLLQTQTDRYSFRKFCLQTEIKKLQELLSSSEEQLEAECQKNTSLSQQLAQLTEIKDLLQLQLDAGGSTGTAAEKLVRFNTWFLFFFLFILYKEKGKKKREKKEGKVKLCSSALFKVVATSSKNPTRTPPQSLKFSQCCL